MEIRNVALSLVFCASMMPAQTNRGGITGTVSDQTGAVIPGAAVIVTNVGTNQEFKAKTSDSGSYSILSLDPVTYRVSVESPGFKKALINAVKVDTGSVATANVTLETGAVSSEITVESTAAQINTESGTSGTTVTERQIQDIPLVNRSVLDLAITQPGVTGDVGSEDPGLSANATVPGYNLSVNGGRPGSTNIISDGVNNTGVSLSRAMVSFSPETVQEFSVQTSAYSAEYGQTAGGIISATTKSGTNRFNGTVLWYNRSPNIAAAPFTLATTNRPKPTLKSNQFSLAAGGPVYIPKIYNGKNKTFWFAAYEPRYRRDFLPQDTLLPTDANRQGDFSNMVATSGGYIPADVARQFGLVPNGDATIYNQFGVVGNQFTKLPAPPAGTTYVPFPNNIIPKSTLDATAQKALKYIAEPTGYYINSAGTVSNLPNPRLLRQDDKRYTLRIDHSLSDNHRLNGRYTTTPVVKNQFTPASITTDSAEYSYAKQAMLADTYTFSPTVINDLRLNYTRGRFSSVPAAAFDSKTGTNLNTELGLPSITKGGVPLLPFIGSGGSTTLEDREERYNITDIVYVNRGKMAWKFGIDLSHALQNVTPLFGAIGGRYNIGSGLTNSTGATGATGGNSFAQFLLGVPDSVDLRNTLIPYYYRWESGAAFVQNDWKVRPNLTLNLGMRYSVNLPRTEKYDHQGAFRPDLAKSFPLSTPIPLLTGRTIDSVQVAPFAFVGKGGRSRYLYPADWKDFEPRFGFAWSPAFLQDQHVTLRGGYGLSHAPVNGNARLPQPDFGATSNYTYNSVQVKDPAYVMRLGENPPVVTPQSVDQAIGITPDGITYLGSLNYNGVGFAISNNVRTPYSQNWNLTISWQANGTTSFELGYLANKGTHLFMPNENVGPKDVALLSALNTNNVSTTATIPDPLGRVNTLGNVISVQQGTLGSAYLGFTSLRQLYDASANSIRHAAYLSVIHRVARGLTFTSNYTFGKTIDDASDSGVDKNVPSVGRVDGQVAGGGTRKNDRSVALYDVRHAINSTMIYDLPFGRGRKLLANAWAPVDFVAGGWTVSSVLRLASGYPAQAVLSDGNQLSDITHSMRPNIVSGVPLVNPLFNRNCPIGNGCQPYLNPSAFERPPVGELGNAPRALDGARGPWSQLFDLSLQKNFKLGESGNRRIQFRVDALNALNHPTFRVFINQQASTAGTDFMGAPSVNAPSAAEYNSWAAANGKPLQSTPEGAALFAQTQAVVNGSKLPSGVLPPNFFTVPLPANFYGTAANAFDITTVQGFKNYRLRQAYNTAFGQLYYPGGGSGYGAPRYIQLGIKIFF